MDNPEAIAKAVAGGGESDASDDPTAVIIDDADADTEAADEADDAGGEPVGETASDASDDPSESDAVSESSSGEAVTSTVTRTPDIPKEQQCTMSDCPEPTADNRSRGGLCAAHLNGETPASMKENAADESEPNSHDAVETDASDASDDLTESDGGAQQSRSMTTQTGLATADDSTGEASAGDDAVRDVTAEPPETLPSGAGVGKSNSNATGSDDALDGSVDADDDDGDATTVRDGDDDEPDPDPDPEPEPEPEPEADNEADNEADDEDESSEPEAEDEVSDADRFEGPNLADTDSPHEIIDRTLPEGWTLDDRVPNADDPIEKSNPYNPKPDLLCPHCCASYIDPDRAEKHVRGCSGIPPYALGKKGRHQQKRRWMASVGYPISPHRPGSAAARDETRSIETQTVDPDAVAATGPDESAESIESAIETHREPRAVKAEMADTLSELDDLLAEEVAREQPRKQVVGVINARKDELKERAEEMGLGPTPTERPNAESGGVDQRDLHESPRAAGGQQ